jgi:hypothetical protein
LFFTVALKIVLISIKMSSGWNVLVMCGQQYQEGQQCTEMSKQRALNGLGLTVTHRKRGHGDPIDGGGE